MAKPRSSRRIDPDRTSVAETLVGYGGNVVIADINGPTARRPPKSSAARRASSAAISSSDADIARWSKATVEGSGRLDFLVNVACVYIDEAPHATRRLAAAFDVNVVGSVMLLKAARPIWRRAAAPWSISASSSQVAQTGRWLYPVSKAAILQLTRNQAIDLAKDRIRVNSVSPGWTWSNIIGQLSGATAPRPTRRAPFHMLGRLGDPDEVAQAVAFLCRTKRPSSPAPTSPSMAATPPWGRSKGSPRFQS